MAGGGSFSSITHRSTIPSIVDKPELPQGILVVCVSLNNILFDQQSPKKQS